MDARTGAGADAEGAGATFAFARALFSFTFTFTFFFFPFRGGATPAASRNSVKLNFRKVSKRGRSGAACTHPLNPKYAVPS